jgi:hypothetical protein
LLSSFDARLWFDNHIQRIHLTTINHGGLLLE